MITLYTWKTPNGRKLSVMLEEVGLDYDVVPVDLGARQQFSPEFLKISPNNKIPAIVDHAAQGLTVFESGAALVYLAEKTGRLLPSNGAGRAKVFEWLFWQMAGVGPMFGQLGHFAVTSKEKLPPVIERFQREAERLLTVLDTQLAEHSYAAGDSYSIADIALYPWIVQTSEYLRGPLGESLQTRPNVQRWLKVVGERPAVVRGLAIP